MGKFLIILTSLGQFFFVMLAISFMIKGDFIPGILFVVVAGVIGAVKKGIKKRVLRRRLFNSKSYKFKS